MTQPHLHVPPAWLEMPLPATRGPILVIGGPDAGKSTFARYLVGRYMAEGCRVALVDGDPGQSSLGPPATMNVALVKGLPDLSQVRGPRWRRFVGDVSPRGHMLVVLVNAARLVTLARKKGAQAVIYDTSGLIDPYQGGLYLKLGKIDLLQPSAVIALRRDQELEPILAPLRASRRTFLYELPVSPAVRPRDPATRRQYRAQRFAAYFAWAQSVSVSLRNLAVIPEPAFYPHQLVGLEDRHGFLLGLGIVLAYHPHLATVNILTRPFPMQRLDTLRLGDLLVDPYTFEDHRLRR